MKPGLYTYKFSEIQNIFIFHISQLICLGSTIWSIMLCKLVVTIYAPHIHNDLAFLLTSEIVKVILWIKLKMRCHVV